VKKGSAALGRSSILIAVIHKRDSREVGDRAEDGEFFFAEEIGCAVNHG
jgi:hypothetical protein